jgi:hypothetical protein
VDLGGRRSGVRPAGRPGSWVRQGRGSWYSTWLDGLGRRRHFSSLGDREWHRPGPPSCGPPKTGSGARTVTLGDPERAKYRSTSSPTWPSLGAPEDEWPRFRGSVTVSRGVTDWTEEEGTTLSDEMVISLLAGGRPPGPSQGRRHLRAGRVRGRQGPTHRRRVGPVLVLLPVPSDETTRTMTSGGLRGLAAQQRVLVSGAWPAAALRKALQMATDSARLHRAVVGAPRSFIGARAPRATSVSPSVR